MGIKGFYGYCQREIPESFKTINILEEIEKYKRYTKFFCFIPENYEIPLFLQQTSEKSPYHHQFVDAQLPLQASEQGPSLRVPAEQN